MIKKILKAAPELLFLTGAFVMAYIGGFMATFKILSLSSRPNLNLNLNLDLNPTAIVTTVYILLIFSVYGTLYKVLRNN